MRVVVTAGFVAGVALLVALGVIVPASTLVTAVAATAIPVLCVSAYRAGSIALYAASWRSLIPPGVRPRFSTLLRLRWIGEALNGLLPVTQVGGDLARARLLTARGVDGAAAAASMLADLTIGIVTQAVFALAGVVALIGGVDGGALTAPSVVGLAVVCGAGAVLVSLLYIGPVRLLARLPPALVGRWRSLAGGAGDLNGALRAMGSRPRALAIAALLHLAGWLSHVGETWLALALLGARISWASALAIESVSSIVRAAAFFIPGGIGVQEGAVVYLCRRLGVAIEPALALGVTKRMREIVVGVPGVVSWMIAERPLIARLHAWLRTGRSGRCSDA